jgi:hypothetical protein
MTPFEQLCAVSKLKPKPGEDFPSFAKRLTKKVNELSDKDWASLGDDGPAQAWHNNAMKVLDRYHNAVAEAKKTGADPLDINTFECTLDGAQFTGVPELEGYEPEPASTAEPEAEEDPEANKEEASGKAKTPEKAASKVKKSGVKAGRKPLLADDAKINILAKENPHRTNTKNFKTFAKYRAGMTVAEALKAGIPRSNIRYEANVKNIRVA